MSGTSYQQSRRASRARATGENPAYTHTGPGQLARQPSRPSQDRRTTDPTWKILRGHVEARMNMMRNWRYSWMEHWQLLEAYILPRRGIFINATTPTPNTMIRGQVINENIIDPTGTQAMRICAAGLMSGLMSPGRPWFKLKPALFPREALGDDASIWFEEVEDRMYQIMQRSNFYSEGPQVFEDLVTFGTAPEIIYDEDGPEAIRCYTPCPGEYFLSVGPDQRVNGLYRLFVWTVAQIVEFFGLENCPRDVQGLWRAKGGSLEMERIVAHAIEPNFEVEESGLDRIGVVPGGFTWRELYWCWGNASEVPLSQAGFVEAPFVAPRWAVTSNDPYGRSVGMDVLQDIMQLQVEQRRKAEGIEKNIRPPMLASMELKNEPSTTVPGGVTYVSQLGADKGMRAVYTVSPPVAEIAADIKDVQARIRTGFFNDLFLMISQITKETTAFEVAQRQQEKMQVLGPVIERWQNEYAGPAIRRIYRIMERKRLLPPLPQSLWNVPLGIEYVSILAQAQKVSATTSMERFAQVTGNLTAAYPEARAMLKPGPFLREYGLLTGVPASVMGDEKDVAAFLQALQQKQQQAEALQVTQAGVAGAETLSKTQVGGGFSALQAMLGGNTTFGSAPAQGAAA